jgi:rsbT antagonist protein RsbS
MGCSPLPLAALLYKLGNCLLMTIQVDMDDRLVTTLQDDLSNKISETGGKGIIIDVSALEIIDSFMGRTFANISLIANLLGVKTVVVGIQPNVAITLVELGLSLKGVLTALTVEKGMKLLQAE